MTNTKRYKLQPALDAYTIEHPQGAWVKYEDFERLRAALRAIADSDECPELPAMAAEALRGSHEPEGRHPGITCIHCQGTGRREDPIDRGNGNVAYEEGPCDTCDGTGRIRTVGQYLKTLPADWHQDSSLETWFPLTANELGRLRGEVCAETTNSAFPACTCTPPKFEATAWGGTMTSAVIDPNCPLHRPQTLIQLSSSDKSTGVPHVNANALKSGEEHG